MSEFGDDLVLSHTIDVEAVWIASDCCMDELTQTGMTADGPLYQCSQCGEACGAKEVKPTRGYRILGADA